MSSAADIRVFKANRVTWIGFYTNLALTAVKLAAPGT